jgi:hypothetical protein
MARRANYSGRRAAHLVLRKAVRDYPGARRGFVKGPAQVAFGIRLVRFGGA